MMILNVMYTGVQSMVRVLPLQIVFLKKPAGLVQKYKASSSEAQR